MASTLPIPPGFVLLKLGGLVGLSSHVFLLPRDRFSTIKGLADTMQQCYPVIWFSIESIKFTIAGGNDKVIANVQQNHWVDLYNKEAFNCISVEEDMLGNDNRFGGYGSSSGNKKYIVYLSMGLWPRVI